MRLGSCHCSLPLHTEAGQSSLAGTAAARRGKHTLAGCIVVGLHRPEVGRTVAGGRMGADQCSLEGVHMRTLGEDLRIPVGSYRNPLSCPKSWRTVLFLHLAQRQAALAVWEGLDLLLGILAAAVPTLLCLGVLSNPRLRFACVLPKRDPNLFA